MHCASSKSSSRNFLYAALFYLSDTIRCSIAGGRQRLDFIMQIYGKKNEKSGIAIELFFHFCYNRNIYAAVVIL